MVKGGVRVCVRVFGSMTVFYYNNYNEQKIKYQTVVFYK